MPYRFKRPFDTSQFTPLSGGRLQHEGEFRLKLTDINKVESRNNIGSMLEFRFRVTAGEFEGHEHTETCAVWHNDPAKRAFPAQVAAAIVRALNGGRDVVVDGSQELVGKELMVTRVQQGEYEGRPNFSSRNWRPAVGTVNKTMVSRETERPVADVEPDSPEEDHEDGVPF